MEFYLQIVAWYKIYLKTVSHLYSELYIFTNSTPVTSTGELYLLFNVIYSPIFEYALANKEEEENITEFSACEYKLLYFNMPRQMLKRKSRKFIMNDLATL